jgi:hypothetical protein
VGCEMGRYLTLLCKKKICEMQAVVVPQVTEASNLTQLRSTFVRVIS